MSPSRPPADANLFPSERPGAQEGSYTVTFGAPFAVDQFGFVRRGILAIEPNGIRYEGRRKRSLAARWGMFLLLTLAPLVVLGVGLGLVFAYAIVNYVWVVNGTISIPARTIASLTRDGRRIRFTAAHPETGKPCRSDIRFELESEALAAERAIGGLMMRARADAAPRSSRRAA